MISALHTGWLRWEGWLDWKGAGSNPSSAPPALGIFISPLTSLDPSSLVGKHGWQLS